MIRNSSSQNGSAFVVTIIILAVAIVGALGFVFWQNFMQPSDTQDNQESVSDLVDVDERCAGDVVEQNGIFCSESIGVEFKIPEVFAGKFQKQENYDVYEGPMDAVEGSPAGKSLEYYEAVVTSGEETLSLSVAKEPLRSGYSSIGHALQKTYFDATSGNLYLVNGPTREYDSATDTTKTTGGWSAGESVPSFDVGETKVYYGSIGDAGIVEDGYLMVVNDHLVVIKIKHTVNLPEEPAFDSEKSFMDLNSDLKQLQILK